MIVGNHDTFYKNTNTVNSVELLLSGYDNITTYTDAVVHRFDKLDVLLCPWICEENAAKTATLLEQAKGKIKVCFGHFEIGGFSMYKGMPNTDGLDPAIFSGFNLTCSGHFHHRSSAGNITYLGSPYDVTWSDYEDPRGFHIFDTKTLELKFIPNTHTMFRKVYWDNGTDVPAAQLTGKCVKLIVVNKTPENVKKLDDYIEKVTKSNPVDLKIIEDFRPVLPERFAAPAKKSFNNQRCQSIDAEGCHTKEQPDPRRGSRYS